MQDVFVNLFTDFGFKKLFGEEPNKDLLISFLNTLLPERHQIENLHYRHTEHLGATMMDRKAIFDLHCLSTQGERFIIELQKAKQNFFKDRSLYYATFPIQEQAQRGDWDFQLSAVYSIGILDFVFDEDRGDQQVHHQVQLKDQHNHVFYDKLTFIYLTLPHFHKTLDQLESLHDKWLYVFRNLHTLAERPEDLDDAVFIKAFESAKIARFEPQERQAYESSLKYYRDLKNVTDTAHDEGFDEGKEEGYVVGRADGLAEGKEQGIAEGKEQGIAEGKEQGIAEGKEQGIAEGKEQGMLEGQRLMLQQLQQQGQSIEQIAELTGLTRDAVRRLL